MKGPACGVEASTHPRTSSRGSNFKSVTGPFPAWMLWYFCGLRQSWTFRKAFSVVALELALYSASASSHDLTRAESSQISSWYIGTLPDAIFVLCWLDFKRVELCRGFCFPGARNSATNLPALVVSRRNRLANHNTDLSLVDRSRPWRSVYLYLFEDGFAPNSRQQYHAVRLSEIHGPTLGRTAISGIATRQQSFSRVFEIPDDSVPNSLRPAALSVFSGAGMMLDGSAVLPRMRHRDGVDHHEPQNWVLLILFLKGPFYLVPGYLSYALQLLYQYAVSMLPNPRRFGGLRVT